MTDAEAEAFIEAELVRLAELVKPLLGLPVNSRDPEAFLRAYLSALALQGAAALVAEGISLGRPEHFQVAMGLMGQGETSTKH